jgi:hypothetical protein
MSKQINPPFDGSAPCPGCCAEVRGASAYIHNFLNRCDVAAGRVREGKAMVKLRDLADYTALPIKVTVPHPAVEDMAEVATLLIAAASKMTVDGLTVRWNPDVLAEVEALIPRAALASDAYSAISDAHFADARHSHGEDNILREKRGYGFSGHAIKNPDTKYDYTVEVVSSHGDIAHGVCCTHLRLHQHFKDRLATDPAFYGKVYCPTCRTNTPWAQWVLHSMAKAA